MFSVRSVALFRQDSWINISYQSPAGMNVRMEAEDILRIRQQATTDEDINWEDFVCAVITVMSEVYSTVTA